MSNTIPVLQLRENSVLLYHEPMYSRQFSNTRGKRLRMKITRKAAYSGKMSDGARKRMCKAITLLCQSSKARWIYNPISKQYQYHKLSFITLTVANSKNLTAKQGYHLLLKHFLQWMRRTKGVKSYIWKAELQIRGQIHWHVTCPDFLDYREIRDEWNRLQKDAGLLDEFVAKYKHCNPNSTDIHEVRQVKNMSGYLVKELAKSVSAKEVKIRAELEGITDLQGDELKAEVQRRVDEEMKTEGKIWDSSDDLAGKPYFSIELSNATWLMLEEMEVAKQCRVLKDDWWSIYYLHDRSPADLLCDNQRKKFEKYMSSIRGEAEEEEIIPVECLAAEIDKETSYTWEQMQLFLN